MLVSRSRFSCLPKRAPRHALKAAASFCLALCVIHSSQAVEVLTVHELVSHCTRLQAEPDGADAQYCVRYIQGFIDGAVATDARVMLNIEDVEEREETFSERAKRTRAPTGADRFRAATLAGFCLGDPLPLIAVVDVMVADLVAMDHGAAGEEPAREAVYRSLQEHYPCPDQ